jgi:hypothetical protein
MSDAAWVALIALGLITMLVQSHFAQRKLDKTAKSILDSNAEIGAQAVLANEKIGAALGSIHTLVNSNLTTARAEQLDATRVMLASLRELASYKESQGVPVSPEAAEAIKLATARVGALSRDIDYKIEQTVIADGKKK